MRIEHWRYAFPLWLRSLLRPSDAERDLDDELRDHVERQTAANVAAGMAPAEARRAALVAFGGVERVKDESRDTRRPSVVSGIVQLRHAARSLWRARVFTVAVIGTIALGVGAGSAIATVINAVLLRPLPYPDSDRLVALWHAFPGIGISLGGQSTGTYALYKTEATSFESIGAYGDGLVTVADPDDLRQPERVRGAGVAGAVFSMLRVRPMIGRVLTDEDERPGAPHVAVISERFWRAHLGATGAVLRRRIVVDGTEYAIVGVLPASFAFPGSDVQVWMPINVAPGPYLGNFSFRAIGRLRAGVSLDAARNELQTILMHAEERFPEQRPGVATARAMEQTRATVVLHRLRDDAIGGFGRVLWLVAATVGVLVLVAISNVASLVLARVEARQRELAVRTTLGASAARLWWSLVAEMAMLSVTGGVIAWGLAATALALLARAGATTLADPRLTTTAFVLPRLNEIHPDGVLVATVFVLTAVVCVVGGVIGTWRASAIDTARVLRDGGRGGTSGRASQRLRAAFVIVEVALSLVLLSGSVVLGRSLLRLLDVRPGFDPANVFTFVTPLRRPTYRTPAEIARFYHDAVARIERIPGVIAAGIVSKRPLESTTTMRLTWVEDAPTAAGVLPPAQAFVATSGGYFRAMGIPLLAGRVFDGANVRRGENEAVVGRMFAMQYWRDSTGRRALGRRFRPSAVGPWYTIVGVVGDVRDTSLIAPPIAVLYLPEDPGTNAPDGLRPQRDMAFVVRTRGAIPDLATSIEREIHAIDPGVPIVGPTLMTTIVSNAGSRMRFVLILLGGGALVTLALGVVGLYGVIAYVVGLRTREIGIRIALGLEPGRATRMILRQGEAIVVVGAAVGLVVFLAFARLLDSLAVGVSVVDRGAVAAAMVVVVGVASLATWLPARRAGRIDPVVALRSEG